MAMLATSESVFRACVTLNGADITSYLQAYLARFGRSEVSVRFVYNDNGCDSDPMASPIRAAQISGTYKAKGSGQKASVLHEFSLDEVCEFVKWELSADGHTVADAKINAFVKSCEVECAVVMLVPRKLV